MEFLIDNWGTVLSMLAGFIIAFYFYKKSLVRAIPKCYLDYARLIGRKEQVLPEEVKIIYKDSPVPRLTMTKAYFWNDGNKTIYGRQIVEDDPLRFEYEADSRILKVNVAVRTREVNKFRAESPSDAINEAKFTFDYLDPGDGAYIEILHTSEEQFPKLRGSLRELPKGIKLSRYGESTRFRIIAKALLYSNAIKGVFYLVSLVYMASFITLALAPTELFNKIMNILTRTPYGAQNTLGIRLMFLILFGFIAMLFLFTVKSKKKNYPSPLNSKR